MIHEAHEDSRGNLEAIYGHTSKVSVKRRHVSLPVFAGLRQSREPSLTVGLLNRPRLKSVARASARAVSQRNDLRDFDGALAKILGSNALRLSRFDAKLKGGWTYHDFT